MYLLLAPAGRISAEADPTRLAYLLLSAFQGGMLLAHVAPLKEALQAAIDYVQTVATPLHPAYPETGSRQPGFSG